MCSKKCANPWASSSSIKDPTPTLKLVEDLDASESEIKTACILFGNSITRYSRFSDKGLIISKLFTVMFFVIETKLEQMIYVYLKKILLLLSIIIIIF